MKINKVIFTCNENEEYVGFWNSISKHFSERMEIEPVLYFLGDPDKFNISKKYGEVRAKMPVKDVPTRIQALWGKFYFTKEEPETTWLIGDLDLYHFDKSYFNIQGDYDYCHLHEFGYWAGDWRTNTKTDLPGYYHVAKGSTFINIFNLNETFDEQVIYIRDSKKYGIGFNGKGWSHPGVDGEYQCCEENLSTDVLREKIQSLKFFGKTMPFASRIDREDIMLPLDSLERDIKSNRFYDMHCPRPYENYQDRIEYLLTVKQ